jgi:hypothetical protein
MIQIILNFVQPITVIGFFISGICCFILSLKNPVMWNYTIINLGLSIVNLFIFYGSKIFK